MYEEPHDERKDENEVQPYSTQPTQGSNYGWYGYDPRYRAAPPPPYAQQQRRRRSGLIPGILIGLFAGLFCTLLVLLPFLRMDTEESPPNTLPSVTPTPTSSIATPAPDLGGGTATLDIVPVVPTPTPMTLDGSGRQVLTNAQIVEKGQPSVVCILVENRESRQTGSGSGIIMTDDGYIITNYHVVAGATNVEVVLHNKLRYAARLVGADQLSDLAVIRIDAEGLTSAEFGDSSSLVVGDPVVIIGNPLGLELQGTATQGMISAINRDIEIDRRVMTTLQTDASVNQGNSGGPMFNQYGQVVGVISSKVMSSYSGTAEGLGFAIPITPAKEVIDDLIKLGYVSGRPTIGIEGSEEITASMARFYGLPQGVRVLQMNENCYAYKQGLRVDDIIVEANGKAVSDIDDLNAIKNACSVGDTMTLTVYRERQYVEISFELMDSGDLM